MSQPAEQLSDAGLIIRRLSHQDLSSCVSIHQRAFPRFFLSDLGPTFLRQFYRAFLNDESAVAFVAESSETVVGVVVGTLSPAGFFRRLLVRRWWAFGFASALLLIRRPAALMRVSRAVFYRGGEDEPGALLSSICVSPAIAGSGIGAQLLSTWSLAAGRLGASEARLETDASGNDAVNRFYVMQGWTLRRVRTTREGRAMNVYVKRLMAGGDSPGDGAAVDD
jgi:ribosomal protein S18 acetylase RimI-like enzyme